MQDLPVTRFAILLPLKGALQEACDRLAGGLPDLTARPQRGFEVCVVFGLDSGDPELDHEAARDCLASAAAAAHIPRRLVRFVRVARSPADPAPICQLWVDMCHEARDHLRADYFLLWGDDVRLKTHAQCWMALVHAEFTAIRAASEDKVPPGFGCVALNDDTNPGFPSFPVISRAHLDMFGGDVVPVPPFVNQDGDPYLFALYRRFGASRFAVDVHVRNTVGGAVLGDSEADDAARAPRYERVHAPNWRDTALPAGVLRIRDALGETVASSLEKMVVDVVTPSYRVDEQFLRGIIEQRVPPQCATMFIVVVDDPHAAIGWLRDLEREVPGRLRVRKHRVNCGASASRNTGIAESDADWILFLDDDVVVPAPAAGARDSDAFGGGLLAAYARAVRAYGAKYDGFVGVTELPYEPRTFPHAVHMSDVSFFYGVSERMEEVPWGVTANLLVRRDCTVAFDLDFMKTGGGEDIDYCLKLRRTPLRAVPEARVLHPWWHGGARCYGHFYRWAVGDTNLLYKHPHLAYRSWPDVVESAVLLGGVAALRSRSPLLTSACAIASIFAVDAAFDLHRNMTSAERLNRFPSRGALRVAASLESSVIKWATQVGHLVGALASGRWRSLALRFDWFCGMLDHVIAEERARALRRFFGFLCATLLCVRIWA